jgi:hypothetical protein
MVPLLRFALETSLVGESHNECFLMVYKEPMEVTEHLPQVHIIPVDQYWGVSEKAHTVEGALG